MNKGLVTVFGGSGFLGKHVVRALVARGYRVRIAMRRPHTGMDLKVIGGVGQVQLMQANLRYEESVIRAVEGADAVINLVAVLYEQGQQSFDALHVKGAKTLAQSVAAAGIKNFVHVSAIGADAESESDYARTKGESEALIRDHVPTADIMRPSIIFGTEDEFFNRFAAMAQLAQRFLIPVPWLGANMLGAIGEITGSLPFVAPFLTRDQVKNLKVDNVVNPDALSFDDLGIVPETVEAIVPTYLVKYRKYGEFHQPGKDSWPEDA